MSKQLELPGAGMIGLGVFVVAFVLLMLIGYGFLAALVFALAIALAVAIFFLVARDRSEDKTSDIGRGAPGAHSTAAAEPARGSAGSSPGTAEARTAASGAPAAPLMSSPPEPEPVPEPEGAVPGATVRTEPVRLDGPREGVSDDLKRIRGVGPKIESLLHGMGIYHLDQIASWGPAEIAWMDENLEDFRGRVSRDDWVGQARLLSGGGETEFSRRVDDGEVYD
jgi:predicted flap endonuclease-1-like 5' DNA nuclease